MYSGCIFKVVVQKNRQTVADQVIQEIYNLSLFISKKPLVPALITILQKKIQIKNMKLCSSLFFNTISHL